MRARVIPAARGALWLLEGWRLFRAAPLGWLTLIAAYWLVMTLVSIIPLAGVVAASMAVPGFAVGFMAAARAARAGARLELGLLFEGFREQPRAQLALGAVYFASLVLVLGASTLADEGALARWMLTGRRPAEEVLGSDGFLLAMALAALAYAPVMMMFWFAPTLVAWHGASAAKALFFSFFGCLMNWRAFLAYGVATVLVSFVVPFVLLSVLVLATGGSLRLPGMTLLFPLLIVLLPTLFASFYASYRDVFDAAAPEAPAAG